MLKHVAQINILKLHMLERNVQLAFFIKGFQKNSGAELEKEIFS